MADANPRDLIKRLADIADALDGRKPLVSAQGQAMDGFTALANFRALADEARAYLDQPEPEGPTAAELSNLWRACSSPSVFARAVLARWDSPALKAVPVSERLPKPEDCDAKGRCWGWMNAEYGWNLYPPEHLPEWSFWLPHWALPVPTK
jgi:hypothetical protein